jgi:hypothetical protein
MENDETGSYITGLVRDGYGISVRPSLLGGAAATVTIERYEGDIRHSNTRAIRTDMGHLGAEIKQAYIRLRNSIRGPFSYDDWRKANVPEYPKPGTF